MDAHTGIVFRHVYIGRVYRTVCIGIMLGNAGMIDQFTNVYSSLYLIVITVVRQLIPFLECVRESNSVERGHVCL